MITISTAKNRFATTWETVTEPWSSTVKRLASPVVTPETTEEYAQMKKDLQLQTKDVGAFVGGAVVGNRRRTTENVPTRSILTLDIDNAFGSEWTTFKEAFPGTAAVLHSTHSHTPEKPRYRLVIPLNREATASEYMELVTCVATGLGDPDFVKTDKASASIAQMMFFPSVSCDAEYIFKEEQGAPLDVDKTIKSAGNFLTSEQQARVDRELGRAPDPREKDGAVGLFCKAYTIAEAIDRFIPGVYTYRSQTRYTYTRGHSAGGLTVYPEKQVAFSHHSTDPANNGHCVNAFDLVRIHLFEHLDKEAHRGTKPNNRPSYKEMVSLINEDEECIRITAEEAAAEFRKEIEKLGPLDAEDEEIITALERDKKLKPVMSVGNICKLLELSALKDRIYFDGMTDARRRITPLPFGVVEDSDVWNDQDTQNLRLFLAQYLGEEPCTEKVEDALTVNDAKNRRHALIEYLQNLPAWDGVPRVDALLSKYLYAEESPRTGRVLKGHLLAAVGRAFYPGLKYDYVIILCGAQRAGKSTFIRALANGFQADGITEDMGERLMIEQTKGAWHVEIPEFDKFISSRQSATLKAFISKQEDIYRAPYARHTKSLPRRYVLWGTSNSSAFLKDRSGNKRYMVVNGCRKTNHNPEEMKPEELAQIYAEVMEDYIRITQAAINAGEDPRKAIEKELREMRAEYEEENEEENDKVEAPDALSEILEDYLDAELPADFPERSRGAVIAFYQNRNMADPLSTRYLQRNRVCIAQLMREVQYPAFYIERGAGAIAEALKRLGWVKYNNTERASISGNGRPKHIYLRAGCRFDTPEFTPYELHKPDNCRLDISTRIDPFICPPDDFLS